MGTLKEDFYSILENQRIEPVFQPIVSLRNGKIVGYEALSRIKEPRGIKIPEELFHLAEIYGKIWELEQLCRSKILERYHALCPQNDNKKLFLNVNPTVIHDKEFYSGFTSQYLHKYKLNPSNIVFEITERSAVDDMPGFKDTIRHYKTQGYKIAIDDAGSCYSGLNLICDIVPHYLKLDISLIHDIHKDTVKYAMVKSMVDFANLTDIQLIAEGIETEEELKTLINLGVHNGQGYFLCMPDRNLKEIEKRIIHIIQKINLKKFSHKVINDNSSSVFRVVLFKFEKYKSYCAYCDKYGDEKGDEVIQMLKTVIVENLSEEETMAMLDADTIVAIIAKKHCKIVSETITNSFRKKIKEYYTKEDLEKGYIENTNEHGENKKYALIDICSERIV